jgi:spore coat protein U-like protein
MVSPFRAAVCGLVLAAGALAPLGGAQATTATGSIGVSATVLSLCVVSASPLAFGNYSPGAVSTANTTIGIVCTNGTTYSVGLNNGSGTGATLSNRLMTGLLNGSTLGYNLYQDSALTTVWGNTVGTNTVAGTGNGLAQSLTVYGKVAAGQNVAPGLYNDTVTVTLTY